MPVADGLTPRGGAGAESNRPRRSSSGFAGRLAGAEAAGRCTSMAKLFGNPFDSSGPWSSMSSRFSACWPWTTVAIARSRESSSSRLPWSMECQRGVWEGSRGALEILLLHLIRTEPASADKGLRRLVVDAGKSRELVDEFLQ